MKTNNNKGITLIALVITIIVLLILAGVSIAMLSGNNGVLTKATQAQVDNKRGEAADKINTALNGVYTALLSDGYIENSSSTTDSSLTASGIISINGLDDEYVVSVKTDEATKDAPVVKIIWVPGKPASVSAGTITLPSDKKDYNKFKGYVEGTITVADPNADINAGGTMYKVNTAKITDDHTKDTPSGIADGTTEQGTAAAASATGD